MMFFSQFTLIFGATLAIISLVAAWLFRSSDAWLGWKLLLPVVLVGLAIYAPYSVSRMLGLPVPATMASLPVEAQLLAFLPNDESQLVDVWLLAGPIPRVYQVPLDKSLKKLLQGAQSDLAQGKPVYLRKKRKAAKDAPTGSGKPANGAPPVTDLQDDYQPEYELDDAAKNSLPPKE